MAETFRLRIYNILPRYIYIIYIYILYILYTYIHLFFVHFLFVVVDIFLRFETTSQDAMQSWQVEVWLWIPLLEIHQSVWW